jgi:phosphoribosylaminoimidazole (AIR) synthetase
MPLIRKRMFKGLAHITGSGFLNVPRISQKHSYRIALPKRDELPSVYDWVRRESELPLEELAQTFNLGIGMVGVVDPKNAAAVLKSLKRTGEKAWILGEVVRKKSAKDEPEVFVEDQGQSAVIR